MTSMGGSPTSPSHGRTPRRLGPLPGPRHGSWQSLSASTWPAGGQHGKMPTFHGKKCGMWIRIPCISHYDTWTFPYFCIIIYMFSSWGFWSHHLRVINELASAATKCGILQLCTSKDGGHKFLNQNTPVSGPWFPRRAGITPVWQSTTVPRWA